MNDHYFDALEYARQLEEAGLTAAQAEVQAKTLARVLEGCLASTADSGRIQSELLYRTTQLELMFREEFKAQLDQVKKDLSARIDKL
ncbi:MAG: hypothetical protein ACXWC4_15245 [Telluria sp.]